MSQPIDAPDAPDDARSRSTAGKATLTTEPSMNARLEPRMVAASVPLGCVAAVVTRAIGGTAESVAIEPSFLATPKDAIDSVPRKGVSGRDFRDSSAISGNEPGCLRCFLGHTPRRQQAVHETDTGMPRR